MRTRSFVLAAIFVLALVRVTHSATPILGVDFSAPTGNDGAAQIYSMGYEFRVLSPVTLVGVAFYDDFKNDFARAHPVGVWDPAGNLIAMGTVTPGSPRIGNGWFRWVPVTPVSLAPGAGYRVAGATAHENVTFFPNGFSVDPHIAFVRDRWTASETLVYPTESNTSGAAYFGGNVVLAAESTPHIETISPTAGPAGTAVTITGVAFGASQGSSTVTFDSGPIPSANIIAWSDDQIRITVPSPLPKTYDVTVGTSGGSSNVVSFEVTCPFDTAIGSIRSLADAEVFLRCTRVLALARLSQAAYQSDPGSMAPTGYTFIRRSSTTTFSMDAYTDVSGDIIVAFRGTANIVNLLLADPCFALLPLPCPLLTSYVPAAVAFVRSLHYEYPTSKITLTGHSLGGGVADILGHASGLETVVFNSPGVRPFLAVTTLFNAAMALSDLNVGHIVDDSNILNVVLQYEQVHLLPPGPAVQIGQQVMVQTDPFGSIGAVVGPSPSLVPVHNHSIDTVVQQIARCCGDIVRPGASQAPHAAVLMYSSVSGATTTQEGQPYTEEELASSVIMPTQTTEVVVDGITHTIKTFDVSVTAHQSLVIDPPVAFAYIFQANTGDPNFASVVLPMLTPSQGQYRIDEFRDGAWQKLALVEPLTRFVFPESKGVDRFRVTATDNAPLGAADAFLVEVAFVSDGRFTGTITAMAGVPFAAINAEVFVGLKNSDDIGTRVDLMGEVFVGSVKLGGGQVNNVATGSSGFNNALLKIVPLDLAGGGAVSPAGSQLKVSLSIRRTCSGSGHASGTVRLWYNGQPVDTGARRDAGTRFNATLGGVSKTYFFREGFSLGGVPGSMRRFIDVPVDSRAGCPQRPFKPVGTWSITLP